MQPASRHPDGNITRTKTRTDKQHTDKLTVLQLIHNLDIGGAQEVVRTLVKHLASDNCTPIVCSFQDGPLRPAIEQMGIRVEILPQRKHSIVALPLFVADMVRIWRSLASLIKRYQVDVVQTHLLTSLDFLAMLLAYTTRVQAVYWTFHSSNFEIKDPNLTRHMWLLGPKRYVHRLLYRWAAPLVGGYIAVSAQVGQALRDTIGGIDDKIFVISNGVDVSKYGRRRASLRDEMQRPEDASVAIELGVRDNTRFIIMVGTLKEGKGHCYMIEAMTLLALRYPDLDLLFVGDGDLRAELERQVAHANLAERIHFLGSRQDVPALLAASTIFVLPSLWEGLSMALLEAMATGLPIVASEVSGTVQALVPDEHGLLVPPGDVQALVGAIEQILSDPDQAAEMGARARQRTIAEFSAQKQADEHLALYGRGPSSGPRYGKPQDTEPVTESVVLSSDALHQPVGPRPQSSQVQQKAQ